MIVAIDTEYDEVTKIPFIATMSDGKTSVLLYPDKKKDYWILKEICGSSKYTKVFHSATSDMYSLHNIGIRVVPPYHCTFIMSSIIDENFSSKKLKELAKKYLHEPCLEAKELNKIKNKYKRKYGKEFRWSMIPKKTIEPYAVKDAEYTIRLLNYFLPKIKKYDNLYKLELDIIPLILNQQIRGHRIDRNFCKSEIKRLNYIYSYYYTKLIKFNKRIFNLQSPKDFGKLIQKTDIDIKERTKTGRVKTDKVTLEPLAKESEIIKWVLICRSALKQINTYYYPLLNEYTSESDDIAHFPFYQSGTKSGRFSAELIQTIPKEKKHADIENRVRKAFIPRDGYILLYFDYDQIEMKLFAHFTNNEILLDAIRKGLDVHERTAIEILGKEKYDEDPVTARRQAKTVNFGIIFGMGSNKLAASLGIPLHEAHIFLSKYDQKFRVKAFISKMTSVLYRQGYIALDWIDREYRVPKEFAYKCVNIIIQGSAAYIIKLAMRELKKYVAVHYGVNLLIQIHDELVFEVHKSLDIHKIVDDIKNIMEDFTTFKVPITASVEYSDTSWFEKKKYEHISD